MGRGEVTTSIAFSALCRVSRMGVGHATKGSRGRRGLSVGRTDLRRVGWVGTRRRSA